MIFHLVIFLPLLFRSLPLLCFLCWCLGYTVVQTVQKALGPAAPLRSSMVPTLFYFGSHFFFSFKLIHDGGIIHIIRFVAKDLRCVYMSPSF